MKKLNEKKSEKIKEFLELANKHNINVNVDLSIYGNPSMDIIKGAKALFKGRLQNEYINDGISKWIRLHNAPKGKKAVDGDLRFNIFYPKD